MLKWIKRYALDFLISVALMLPTWLLGFYKGYYEAEQIYSSAMVDNSFKQDCYRLSEDLANLRNQYYKVSNDLKDTMTEMLKYKLELQEKKEAQ